MPSLQKQKVTWLGSKACMCLFALCSQMCTAGNCFSCWSIQASESHMPFQDNVPILAHQSGIAETEGLSSTWQKSQAIKHQGWWIATVQASTGHLTWAGKKITLSQKKLVKGMQYRSNSCLEVTRIVSREDKERQNKWPRRIAQKRASCLQSQCFAQEMRKTQTLKACHRISKSRWWLYV